MSDPNAWQLPTFYTADKKEQLRYKFKNVDLVNHQNFSQCYQDMFVLCMLDGKPYGTFCEIGAGHPVISNNTALLESRFAWNGIGFEIKEHEADLYNEHRKAPIALGDATTADFDVLFEEVKLEPSSIFNPTIFAPGATPLIPILFPPTAEINPAIVVP